MRDGKTTEEMSLAVRGILQVLRGKSGACMTDVYAHCLARGDNVLIWPRWTKDYKGFVTEEAAAELIYEVMEAKRLECDPVSEKQQWIPVGERMPKNGEKVLAFVVAEAPEKWSRRIRAFYCASHTIQADEETIGNEGAEYDPDEDEYYLAPGWYEENEYEDHFWFVSDNVTHWMPLPEAPK